MLSNQLHWTLYQMCTDHVALGCEHTAEIEHNRINYTLHDKCGMRSDTVPEVVEICWFLGHHRAEC